MAGKVTIWQGKLPFGRESYHLAVKDTIWQGKLPFGRESLPFGRESYHLAGKVTIWQGKLPFGRESCTIWQGKLYHLAGKVVVCPTATFKKTLENTATLLAWKNSTCVVVPPLPRYIFSGCCPQKDHCTNVGKPNHEKLLLAEIVGLRNTLKRFVASLGTGRSRVLDCCCVADCKTTANIDTRLEALRRVTASDGVHYQSSGYENIVKNILGAQHSTKQMVNCSQRHKLYFWRGFRSPIGSNTVMSAVNHNHGGASLCRATRGRLQKGKWYGHASHTFHPY